MQKLPWSSLILLLFTHSVFGWLLATPYTAWSIWLIWAVGILLISLALAAPLKLIRELFGSLLKSDNRAIIWVIVCSFIAVLLLCWINLFIRVLVLIAASARARLDLLTMGCNNWLAFGILGVVSLVGYGLGLWVYQII